MNRLSVRACLIIFACVFAVALLLLIPMRFGIGWSGLGDDQITAQRVTGSLWRGHLTDATIGRARVGSVAAELQFSSLFSNMRRFSIGRAGEQGNAVTAIVGLSRSALEMSDVSGHFSAGQIPDQLPIRALSLENLTVRFEEGACVSADGLVRIDVAPELGGFALPERFTGSARCQGDSLLLPLTSQSGMEALNLRIEQSGAYSFELEVRTEDQALRDGLLAAGFEPGANGHRLTGAGQL
jgi:general secretion pathway protein N